MKRDEKSFKTILRSSSALADFQCLAPHPFQMKPKDLQEGTTQHRWGCPQPRGARTRWLQPSSRMPGATSAEVPVRQHQRSHQGPEVEQEPGPAGADLHPHGGPGARQHPQALIQPEIPNSISPHPRAAAGGISLRIPSTVNALGREGCCEHQAMGATQRTRRGERRSRILWLPTACPRDVTPNSAATASPRLGPGSPPHHPKGSHAAAGSR